MKSLFEVGAKHIHYMNRTRRVVFLVHLAGNEDNTSVSTPVNCVITMTGRPLDFELKDVGFW